MEGYFWCGLWLDIMKYVISLVFVKRKIFRLNKIVFCCIFINIYVYLFLGYFLFFLYRKINYNKINEVLKLKGLRNFIILEL